MNAFVLVTISFGLETQKADYIKCRDMKLRQLCILGILSVDGKQWICHTCAESLKKVNTPLLSVADGFTYNIRS